MFAKKIIKIRKTNKKSERRRKKYKMNTVRWEADNVFAKKFKKIRKTNKKSERRRKKYKMNNCQPGKQTTCSQKKYNHMFFKNKSITINGTVMVDLPLYLVNSTFLRFPFQRFHSTNPFTWYYCRTLLNNSMPRQKPLNNNHLHQPPCQVHTNSTCIPCLSTAIPIPRAP